MPVTLRALLDRAGEPPALASDVELVDELERLESLTAPDQVQHWYALSRKVQVLWLSFIVARARAVKDRVQFEPGLKQRLRDTIVRLPEFAADARPGHVNGMRVAHEAQHGSWTDDARFFLRELRAHAEPPATPAKQVEKPSKRRERPSARHAQPLDWPLRERVASMRVVLFGGAPREGARENLERVLGIGSLEWPENDKPRRVGALTESVAAGKVDLLLVNRYVQQKESSKLIDAAQASGTPFAVVEVGYGVEAVRHAIEEALHRGAHPTAAR